MFQLGQEVLCLGRSRSSQMSQVSSAAVPKGTARRLSVSLAGQRHRRLQTFIRYCCDPSQTYWPQLPRCPLNHWACRLQQAHVVPRRWGSTKSAFVNQSLYDVLGVGPKATQEEIKTAYYKLSMTYHPDKNRDSDEAARRFREITEAYETLGNFLNRRKYDRGMITGTSHGGDVKEDEAVWPERTEFTFRWEWSLKHRRGTPLSGRSSIYNFDEWTQTHYGDTFARQQKDKKWHEEMKKKDKKVGGERNVEALLAAILGIMIAAGFLTTVASDTWNPRIRPQQTSDNKSDAV